MKKITLIITVLLSVSLGTAIAQEEGNGKIKGPKVEKLKTELRLSDKQAGELKLVFNETRKEVKGIKSNEAISKEDKRSQVKAAKENSDTKIESILTEEQLAKYDEIKANRKEKSGAKRHDKRDAILDELGVTEAQKLELKKIKEDAKVSTQKVKNDSSLSDEEKKAKVKVLRNQADKKVQKVLTAEQYKALEINRKETRQKRKGNREKK